MKKKIAVIVGLLIVGGFSVAYAWKSRSGDSLTASGTLEARNINIGSKVGGRVSRVLAHEGDHVEAHQLLVVFESGELEGQLLQAQGRVEAARANVAKMVRGSRPEEIAEANAASNGSIAALQIFDLRAASHSLMSTTCTWHISSSRDVMCG